MPPQVGQAPNGLLNENSRGSISAMVKPETGQAKLDEKVMRPRRLALGRVGELDDRRCRRRARARSRSESARRAAMSARTTMRSTTTSMSCLSFLSSFGASSIGVVLAVDLAGAGSPSSGTRRSPCGTRPCGRGPRAPAGRAASSPAAPAPGRPSADGLALDRQAGGGRVGDADPRPEQAHVVVDLGDRAHGRARVLRGGLLLDGDRRREPVDLVDVGLAASSPGTGAHRPRATRRSGAAPRRRSCRRRATTCPSPTAR